MNGYLGSVFRSERRTSVSLSPEDVVYLQLGDHPPVRLQVVTWDGGTFELELAGPTDARIGDEYIGVLTGRLTGTGRSTRVDARTVVFFPDPGADVLYHHANREETTP